MKPIVMNFTTVSTTLIDALNNDGIVLIEDDLIVFDAADLIDTDAVNALFNTLGARMALLLNVDEAASKLLYPVLGIRGKGASPYMLIRPIGESAAGPRFHIVDYSQNAADGSGTLLSATGEAPAGSTPPGGPEFEEELAAAPMSTSLDDFAEAVVQAWDLPKQVEATSGPKEHYWIYTRATPFNPAGSKGGGYTPPSDQTLTINVSYTFRAFLNDAESGQFQWLYVETLGHMISGGMKKNDHNRRGWGNGSVTVNIPAPSATPLFYDASPANTNNQKQVTTTVGFDVGYQSGSLNYSKSQTEVISDWQVVQKETDAWIYQMSSPFKGNSKSFPTDAVKYNAGKARHEVKAWPVLTTDVFRWSTMSVYRNDRPWSGNVSVSPHLEAQAIFMYLHNAWPSWDAYYWHWVQPIWEQFNLNFAVVTND